MVEKWQQMFQGYEQRQQLWLICFGEADSAHSPEPLAPLWQLSSTTSLPAEWMDLKVSLCSHCGERTPDLRSRMKN